MAGRCAEKIRDIERAPNYYVEVVQKKAFKATPYGPKAEAALKQLGEIHK